MAKQPVRRVGNNVANRKKLQNQQRKASPLKKRPFKTKVQDARQLIRTKRSKVRDARDVLAKLARGQDARDRLNKLRQGSPNAKLIGKNIVRTRDRDGNLTLTTNKSKTTLTGINAAIQKELGLVTVPKKAIRRAPPTRPLPRPTILSEAEAAAYLRPSNNASIYKWSKPGLRPTASQLIGSLVDRRQSFTVTRPLRLADAYIDVDLEDEEMPMAPPVKQTITLQGSSRVSNVHSRLDGSPSDQDTHGIFGQTKTKVVVPAGHRIVVSNLQPTVTQDDVKELFEDIGQLLAARLVRPGVAEVIYKNIDDANKAVETYHNRQLDGQPMKCMLVHNRPLNKPTAPAVPKKALLNAVEVTTSSKLVPDLPTIHKVLFARK